MDECNREKQSPMEDENQLRAINLLEDPPSEWIFNVKACDSGFSLLQVERVSSDQADGHFCFQQISNQKAKEYLNLLLQVS